MKELPYVFRFASLRDATPLSVNLRLKRRDEGWINGDIHLRFARVSHTDSAFWRKVFEAHDLTMGNVMV